MPIRVTILLSILKPVHMPRMLLSLLRVLSKWKTPVVFLVLSGIAISGTKDVLVELQLRLVLRSVACIVMRLAGL